MFFDLPKSTLVNRFIPKNSFDEYSSASQKKKFKEWIEKITWLNKLSVDTINLNGNEIDEIQIFEIQLKEKENIMPLLNIIDKAIPYYIIFVIIYRDEIKISTSKKHGHIHDENNAVIDWTFTTEWLSLSDFTLQLNLKESIDSVYADFCAQISNKQGKNIDEIVEVDKQTTKILKQIADLERKIKNEKQFNIKVELNQKLKALRSQLL